MARHEAKARNTRRLSHNQSTQPNKFGISDSFRRFEFGSIKLQSIKRFQRDAEVASGQGRAAHATAGTARPRARRASDFHTPRLSASRPGEFSYVNKFTGEKARGGLRQ